MPDISKNSSRRAPVSGAGSTGLEKGLFEGLFILLIALTSFLLLALLSHDANDPGWTYTGSGQAIGNLMGRLGAWVADVLLYLFGYMAYLLPMILLQRLWTMLRDRRSPGPRQRPLVLWRLFGFVLTLTAGAVLAAMHFYAGATDYPAGGGGVLGEGLLAWLSPGLGYVGATLCMLAVFLTGVTLASDFSWLSLMEWVGRWSLSAWERGVERLRTVLHQRREQTVAQESRQARQQAMTEHTVRTQERKPPRIEPIVGPPEVSLRVEKERQGNLFKTDSIVGLPPIHLLDAPAAGEERGYSAQDLEAMSRLLELKLRDFSISAEVVAVLPGPVITRFELQLAAGTKASRITNLAKDLARSLAVISVRVVEVIPGKSVIGIEIPNMDRQTVYLRDVLSTTAYDRASSPISLALGDDISGQPVIVDLGRMPHLLVAGTTGSGKSVALNAMLLSILFKARPDEVRLIMVDPKMLELSIYEGIPHLLTPVVTDMKDAANTLRWCVAEMERRYRLMATLGVRNLSGYNRKLREAATAGSPIKDPLWQPEPSVFADEEPAAQEPPDLEALPFIVVVIDEFADMMMIVGKKVEELIARIAQKARAAGIHLILATQRPSVDVITGLIKANIPTRIAFQVSSKIDSRTILDQGGAEQLLGHGDMLYLPAGSPIPTRVHGAFVSDEEVHRVVDEWRSMGEPQYLASILDAIPDYHVGTNGGFGGEADGEDGESDPLYDEAVQFVTESRRASISAVQRKLRVGYNRAARIIETMERAGVVSAQNTNGSREVLAPPAPE